MLLLFLFFVLFLCVFFLTRDFFLTCFFLTRDSNMISIDTVEFRHYVAIIIPVNLRKP